MGIDIEEEEKFQKLKKILSQLIKTEKVIINLTKKTDGQAANSTVRFTFPASSTFPENIQIRAGLRILDYKKVAGAEEREEVWELLKKHEEMERKHKDFLSEMKNLDDTPSIQYIFEQV